MRKFELTITAGVDAPAILKGALGVCESLAVRRENWARLMEPLGIAIFPYLQTSAPPVSLATAAKAIVWTAMPGVQDERATVNLVYTPIIEATFITPGQVSVTLTPKVNGDLTVAVDFGRESRRLATLMLPGFVSRRVAGAARLLAIAATELADYEGE